jgi:hypothetical protein
MVLVVLAEHANDEAVCWPGYQTIARRGLVDRTTVFRSIEALEALGELRVERRAGPKGQHRYVVHVAACNRLQDATDSERQPVAARNPLHAATERLQLATQEVAPCNPNRKGTVKNHQVAERVPRTAGRARKQGPERTAPDPRVRALIAAFCEEHQRALGTPYLIAGGRDGAALKRALTKFDESRIRQALSLYFRDRQSIEKLGARVPLFVERLGGLLAGLNGRMSPPPRDFTGEGQAAAKGQA